MLGFSPTGPFPALFTSSPRYVGRRRWSAPLWIAALAFACGDEPQSPKPNAPPQPEATPSPVSPPAAPSKFSFPDEAAARGIDYRNASGEAAKATILEANGAGVALIDLGEDGDLDVVFAQGLPALKSAIDGPGADLAVFENDGTGHFTRATGPGLSGWWTGLATGDVDGDGDTDLIAAGYGALVVLLQDEHGQLARAAGDLMPADRPGARLTPGEPRTAGNAPLWATSVALFDADRDGVLDLYVCGYLALDPLAPPIGEVGEGPLAIPCRWKGYPVYCGPHGLKAQPDRVFRGLGAGRFEDVTAQWTPGIVAGYSLGVAPFDADGDGDTDVYVARDSVSNLLLINDGAGHFSDVAYTAGVALSQDGAPEAGMGVAPGDVDRDGLLDFALTNFSGEPTELFFGAKMGFANQTYRFGLLRETRALLKWSVHLTDFDGDGWLELFTANGHVYPEADREGTALRTGNPPPCGASCPSVARRASSPIRRARSSQRRSARGSAVGDLDGDGAPDIVLSRIDGPASLGMNRCTPRAHRLLVRCLGPSAEKAPAKGPRTPPDGKGARAFLMPESQAGAPAELVLLCEAQTSVGYQSASSPWLSFGLGQRARYASLRVVWPSGRVEELGPGDADRKITVREGDGIVRAEALK